jgi:histidyl-tRNA synthetase
VGTDSLLCEAEIILMITEVFARLGINDYTIKINHRGILSGVAELANGSNEMALFVAIDKLDKVGEEKVREELRNKGFDEAGLDVVFSLLNQPGSASEKINFLTEKFANSPRGQKGTAEVQTVLQLLHNFGGSSKNVELDVSLARGLSYYTGCIFEVKINNVAIGSVSGGGRYDNLTQAFGAKEKLSGVGISFGIDRLYDAMDELKLFSEASAQSTKVLICWFDETSRNFSLRVVQQLRSNGIAAEIYPDAVKIQKQLDYANKKNMPFVVLIGSDEVASASVTLKNMQTGQQQKVGVEQLAAKIR